MFIYQLCSSRPDDDHGRDGTVQAKVSVNVPQFFMPPVAGVSQVSVKNLSSEEAEAGGAHPQERRRTVSLPDECRKSFCFLFYRSIFRFWSEG